jgi:hypothetical protein
MIALYGRKCTKGRDPMKSSKIIFTFLFLTFPCLFAGCKTTATYGIEPVDLPILQKWSGDYPVVDLKRLPKRQQKSRVGFIGEAATFAAVWHAFKLGEEAPAVNFRKNLVIYSRNVDFYNRTSIFKVTLTGSVVEIYAMETSSALPIGDKVAMAMVVIPRAGVKFVQADNKQIPVAPMEPGGDPLNATYTIEEREINLLNGRSEVEAAPLSTTKIKTSVFGRPVFGDLDGDGDEDAALILVHDPGGSGTFYYVAAALNENGVHRGTNAVLLGDRVAPHDVGIRNGVVVANYADRRPEEPMTALPSIGKSKYLTLNDAVLVGIGPLEEGEQVVEGWVTIGHEVRSFLPCSLKNDIWIQGNSPAMKKIMAAYRQALPNSKPYTPLFMVLSGKYAARPTDGFGTEYETSFLAKQIVRMWPEGNCRSEYIVVSSPSPGALVNSPLKVRGKARGIWFFEGDFPIVLRGENGKIIAEGFVTATDEWMTEKFVPFEGTLTFDKPRTSKRGTLVFKKDNPTGNPEHDDALKIPVLFR